MQNNLLLSAINQIILSAVFCNKSNKHMTVLLIGKNYDIILDSQVSKYVHSNFTIKI